MKPTIEALKMGPKRHGHFRSPLTGVDLIVLPVKAAGERERAMSEGRACVAGCRNRGTPREPLCDARAAEGGRATTAQTSNGIQKRWPDEEDSDAEDSGADGGTNRGRVTAHYTV